MSKPLYSFPFIILVLNFFFGFLYAVPYDHAFTGECLLEPLIPLYNGGIVVNPELNDGLKGWTIFGGAKIRSEESGDGNKYIVASERNDTFQSFAQTYDLDKDKFYTFSAWLQVSNGTADIAAVFKTQTGFKTAGWVTAQKGCWSMLKGGLVVEASGPTNLYFASNNLVVDIWGDSISLQPFTQEEWKSDQDQNIEKTRKGKVKLQAVDELGRPIANATVSIKQRRPNFPFGCAINQHILGNTAYQNWFLSRFKFTVFENELKWYATESIQGKEDYSIADALVNFTRSHGISTRGHNVLWDDPRYQPDWLTGISTNDLSAAANRRLNSVVGRYRGQFIHWDVVNENLHSNFFESNLGANASANFYKAVNSLDNGTTPFLNDFNVIEVNNGGPASPSKYLQKIAELRSEGYNGPLGIGLESHFNTPNIPYIRAAIDQFATTGLPIWITELDVRPGPNQASILDQLLRELYSNAAVQGIIIWSAWRPTGCYRMCLTDNSFKNLATGDVVDKFRGELIAIADTETTTDSNGFFEASLIHGEYEAKITHPNGNELSNFQRFSVQNIF